LPSKTAPFKNMFPSVLVMNDTRGHTTNSVDISLAKHSCERLVDFPAIVPITAFASSNEIIARGTMASNEPFVNLPTVLQDRSVQTTLFRQIGSAQVKQSSRLSEGKTMVEFRCK
jgi:hypothetical protein